MVYCSKYIKFNIYFYKKKVLHVTYYVKNDFIYNYYYYYY